MARTPDFRKNKNLIDVIVDKGRPPRMAETGWYRIAATALYESAAAGGQYYGSTLAVFQNSWQNSSISGAPPASWYVSESGETRMRGKVGKGGTALDASVGQVLFVLPEEARPEYAETFICATDTGTANVTVYPNGNVTFDSYA